MRAGGMRLGGVCAAIAGLGLSLGLLGSQHSANANANSSFHANASAQSSTPNTAAPQSPLEASTAPTIIAGEFTQGGWARIQFPEPISAARLNGAPIVVSADGRALIAFDRDAGSQATLEYRGQTSRFAITPRQWKISRVNVPKRSGGSSEAWWKKRKPEWEAIVAARAKVTDAQGWRQDFIWPVKGRISGLFGRQRIYQGEPGSYHSGIDIAPGAGVPYVAPADGVVALARTGFSLEGGLIILDHGGGLNSAFLHSSKILVKEGEAVKQGQRIGHVGSTGRSTGPHLHWSLKWHDARLDPLLLTGPMD